MPRRSSPDTLMLRSAGLNTRLDPERLQQANRQNGYEIEFAQAVNVSLDERGLPELRTGKELLEPGEYHSLFCSGGDCFVIHDRTNDAAIMQVTSLSPLTLTGVRSGLTKGLRMAWAQSNADTFYSNGTQNGFIRSGVSSAWPIGIYNGPDDDRSFSAAPIASHIAFLFGGMVALASGSGIYLNHAPYQYGLFNLRSGYIGFQSNVIMLASNASGFFVSDEERTWFFRKLDGWYRFKQELVADYPAMVGAVSHDAVPSKDLGFNAAGLCRVWGSQEGICVGLPDGSVESLTQDRVPFPQGYTSGACLVYQDTKIIQTCRG